MPQKQLDSEYECGSPCSTHRGLLSSGLWNKCEWNGLDKHHEEYLIKYSAVLLRQRAVETPCRCGSGAGIYISITGLAELARPAKHDKLCGYMFQPHSFFLIKGNSICMR